MISHIMVVDVFHNGIATVGLELKIENERSTVVGSRCRRKLIFFLHIVDLQNTP